MNKSSVKLLVALLAATIVMFIAVVGVAIVEIKQISTINDIKTVCGDVDGIWLTDSSTGKSTRINVAKYVEEKVDVNELATTSYGVNYSKEGEMTLLDVDCDVKEAFEILDCIKMHVKITVGNTEYYQAYARGSDGFTYLVKPINMVIYLGIVEEMLLS